MGHKRSNLLKCAKMHGNTVFKAKVKWNSNKLESQYLARLPLLFNKTLLGKISGIVSWRIFKVHLWINCALITLKFGLWEPNRWLVHFSFQRFYCIGIVFWVIVVMKSKAVLIKCFLVGITWWITIWQYFSALIRPSAWTRFPTSLTEKQPQTMTEPPSRFADGCRHSLLYLSWDTFFHHWINRIHFLNIL